MKAWMLPLFCVLLSVTARADSVTCFTFEATPDAYAAPAGGQFTVFTTYTNCGTEGYAVIGDSFGSDEDPNIAGIEFFDPFAFIAPGDSLTLPFASYKWTDNAPAGYSQVFNINAVYGFLEVPCDNATIPCIPLEGGGFAWTQFTGTVPGSQSEVPEPSTLVLLSTGAAILAAKVRKVRATRT